MTRIDFYILPDGEGGTSAPAFVISKLCEKATRSGARVYVRVTQPAMADEIDTSLWTFNQGSFISHERHRGDAGGEPAREPHPSVLIGDGEPPESHLGILVNFGEDVPLYFSRFERVLEIVPATAADRTSSRTRFKFYRDRGYELSTHNL